MVAVIEVVVTMERAVMRRGGTRIGSGGGMVMEVRGRRSGAGRGSDGDGGGGGGNSVVREALGFVVGGGEGGAGWRHHRRLGRGAGRGGGRGRRRGMRLVLSQVRREAWNTRKGVGKGGENENKEVNIDERFAGKNLLREN